MGVVRGVNFVRLIDGRLQVPEMMLRLVDAGIWPSEQSNLESQNLSPIVAPDSIRIWAPEERTVYFYPIPTVSIQTLIDGGDRFWLSEIAAPSGLNHKLAVTIGDLGIGSDAPIVLDYRSSLTLPRVLRLQWNSDGNEWIKISDSFDEFVDLAGLATVTPRFREPSDAPKSPVGREFEL